MLKKKMYIANHYEFTGQESYLNHLIDEIHNSRGLRAVTLDFYSNDISKIQKQFEEIITNLKNMYSEDMYEKYQKTNKLLPLSVLVELLMMFPRLSFTVLYEKMNYILTDVIKTEAYSREKFSALISLLKVANYIQRIEDNGKIYFEVIKKDNNFFIFDEFTERELIAIESAKLTYEGMGS